MNCDQRPTCQTCGEAFDLIRFYPMDQSNCPSCRGKERSARRKRGGPIPAFEREPFMLRKQAN